MNAMRQIRKGMRLQKGRRVQASYEPGASYVTVEPYDFYTETFVVQWPDRTGRLHSMIWFGIKEHYDDR